jgi:hypothetical protein
MDAAINIFSGREAERAEFMDGLLRVEKAG